MSILTKGAEALATVTAYAGIAVAESPMGHHAPVDAQAARDGNYHREGLSDLDPRAGQAMRAGVRRGLKR